jgi:hypothetical protein
MVQDPLVGEQSWPYTMNPLPHMFKNLYIKLLVNNFLVERFLQAETNKHCLHLWLWNPDFIVAGWIWKFPLQALQLCFRIILTTPTSIVSNSSDQSFVILLDLLQQILPPLLLVLSKILGRHICTNFLRPQIFRQFNPKTSIILHQRCYLFDVSIRFWCFPTPRSVTGLIFLFLPKTVFFVQEHVFSINITNILVDFSKARTKFHANSLFKLFNTHFRSEISDHYLS